MQLKNTTEKFLSKTSQDQPDSVESWFSLGNLHLAQGRFHEAEQAYHQALRLQPNSLPIYNNLGYALQQQGLFDEAIQYYQKALELKPDFAEAAANLGNALHAQSKLSSEQKLYYAQLNNKLGVARKKAGDMKTAVAYYRQAIALQPDFVAAHYNLGVVLQEQGELEEAIACAQRVLQLNPSHGQVYKLLEKIYQGENKTEVLGDMYCQALSFQNHHYAQAIAVDQDREAPETALITPAIPEAEVTVGAYKFPAIPPVKDDGHRPFWSVVITVYNRMDYLPQCLASVLAQWPGPEEMEILVMDNASETPVLEMVNSIGKGVVRCYRHSENIGPVKNMNAGIALARGKWIHILHDDDCVLPGFYARLKQSLEGCSASIGAAFTGFEYINETGERLYSQEYGYGQQKGIPQDWLQKIGIVCLVMLPAVVIRRATFEQLGGYYPQLPEIADWELNKRIASFYDWWYESGILACYREHTQRLSNEYWGSWKQTSAFRQAIEISESYIPAKYCAEITAKARSHYFDGCLASALKPIKAGDISAAFRILQETIKLDQSSKSLVKLFSWLTTEEATPLREEIASKLIPKIYQHLSTENMLDAQHQECLFFRKVSLDMAAEVSVYQAFHLAGQYQRANRLTEAEQIYLQVLETQPFHAETLYELGVLAQQRNHLQDAEKFLSRLLQLQPHSDKAWFRLGNLRQAQNQLIKAEEAYQRAIALQPNTAAVYNNLGYTLQKQGKWEEAIACYQTALELEPNYAEAQVNLGNALYAQGKLSSEKQVYYAALNNQLGKAQKQALDLKAAVDYYRQAIVLQPDLLEAHYNLGIVLEEQGELEEAVACHQRVLEINPNHADVYFNLGRIYQKQHQLQKAASAYRQGLILVNPHYALAVAGDRGFETTQPAQATPLILQSEIVVGDYKFPAIPCVSESTDQRPFWSVVIPVYQRMDYLLECLASVLSQWAGEEQMEILVMDNASTQPIFELVNAIGGGIVKYYRHPQNIGALRNYNAGIALSRGHWIHLLNDDDYVLPGFYCQLQQNLEKCSDNIGAAFTGYKNINEQGKVLSSIQLYGEYKGIAQNWLHNIGVANSLNMVAVVIRREAHERLGVYHPELTLTSDWELYKRIASIYDWWCEPGILACYREHSNNLTTEVFLSGDQGRQIRRAIELSESYFPADLCSEITAKARSHYFNYCLAKATTTLNNRNIADAFRLLQEAIQTDDSYQSVTNLFAWLTQDKVAPVRDEIAFRLLSLPFNKGVLEA